MTRCLLIFFAILLLHVRLASVSAWNDAGHMTIARIAWDQLEDADRERLIAILRQHPHLDSILLKDQPADASESEWLFLRASIWADVVRPPKTLKRDEVASHPLYRFHRGNWHYVNFPYKSGQLSHELPHAPISDDPNILKQLRLTIRFLELPPASNAKPVGIGDAQERAVQLTWLMHLLGDLHQPMHVISLVDDRLFPDFPFHDQGGNKLAVRVDSNSPPKNLHWFWDEIFSTDSRYDHVRQTAERLCRDPGLQPSKLPEIASNQTLEDWAAESYRTAISFAYLDGKLKPVLWDEIVLNQRAISDVPVIPPEILKQARQAAHKRIVLAGRRMAVLLKNVRQNHP